MIRIRVGTYNIDNNEYIITDKNNMQIDRHV